MLATGTTAILGTPGPRVTSPMRRRAQLAAAREAGLTAGMVRLYVGCADGTVLYRVAVSAACCWQYALVRYDPFTRSVTDCPCCAFAERRICEHAGATLLRKEYEARHFHH